MNVRATKIMNTLSLSSSFSSVVFKIYIQGSWYWIKLLQIHKNIFKNCKRAPKKPPKTHHVLLETVAYLLIDHIISCASSYLHIFNVFSLQILYEAVPPFYSKGNLAMGLLSNLLMFVLIIRFGCSYSVPEPMLVATY